MRSILVVTLLVATVTTPPDVEAQQLGAGDAISIRRSVSAVPQPRWGDEQPRPTRSPLWTTATVVRPTSDTLWYSAGEIRAQMSLENAEVRRSTGRNHRWLGAVLGGATVGAIGGLLGYAAYNPKFEAEPPGFMCWINCDPPPPLSRAEGTATWALLGAAIGGSLGFRLGKAIGNWESVDLTPSLAEAGGVSLSLRVGLDGDWPGK